MLKFSELLIEKNNMEGTVGTERKGVRHVMNYILPYLSDKQRADFLERHADTGLFDVNRIKAGHGAQYNPDTNTHTHVLASSANGNEAGTPVRVNDVHVDDYGRIMVNTANHGWMQASKLDKPANKLDSNTKTILSNLKQSKGKTFFSNRLFSNSAKACTVASCAPFCSVNKWWMSEFP